MLNIWTCSSDTWNQKGEMVIIIRNALWRVSWKPRQTIYFTMMSLTVFLPIIHMRFKDLVNWCYIQAWVYGTYSRCLSVQWNQIFFLKEASWLPLYCWKGCLCKGLPPHCANLLLSRAGCTQAAPNMLAPRMCLRSLYATAQLTRAKTVPGL